MVAAHTNGTATTGPVYRITHRTTGADPTLAYTLTEPARPASDLTLVLLHGAAHDEHCWQEHWTPYLAEHGWRCLTVSYRAHGKSTWSQSVQGATLDDYAADVLAVLDAEERDPCQVVLIGHSLGGGVAQRVAEHHEIAGMVLVSSLAFGLWMQEVLPKMPGQFLRHPRVYPSLRTDPSTLFASPRLARAFLFDAWTPEATVQWYLNHCWCHESGKVMQDLLAAKPHPWHARPLLFVAGRKDASVSLRSMRRSAARWHAPLVEVEAPHDVMLAGDWRSAAEAVVGFAQQCQERSA